MDARTRGSDTGEGASAIVDVATAVAEAEGIDPAELTPPIGDVVDPDALNAMLANSPALASLRFEYRGWDVEMWPGGSVVLGPIE